jgi:hypothetical protein
LDLSIGFPWVCLVAFALAAGLGAEWSPLLQNYGDA